MDTTITVRVDHQLREELERQAGAMGKSLSERVRDILIDAVGSGSLGERAIRLKGTLTLSRRPTDPWRRELRQRNWRP